MDFKDTLQAGNDLDVFPETALPELSTNNSGESGHAAQPHLPRIPKYGFGSLLVAFCLACGPWRLGGQRFAAPLDHRRLQARLLAFAAGKALVSTRDSPCGDTMNSMIFFMRHRRRCIWP